MTVIRRAHCPVCLLPGTPVYSHPGFKPIQRITAGEVVQSYHGGTQTVEQTFQRFCREEVVALKARYMAEVRLTPEHPVLVSEVTETRPYPPHLRVRTLSAPKWKWAGNLKAVSSGAKEFDAVVVPKFSFNSESETLEMRPFVHRWWRIPYDADLQKTAGLFELLGWYVAEGHTHEKGVGISLGSHEKDYIERIRYLANDLGFSTCLHLHGTTTQVEIPTRTLSRAIALWCGKGARYKKIPLFVMEAPLDMASAFLSGYEKGDGHQKEDGGVALNTVSWELAHQLQMLYLRSGRVMGWQEREGSNIFQDRQVNGHRQFILNERRQKEKWFFEDERYYYFPVQGLSFSAYEGPVYNLKTGQEHFCLPFIVHNCGFQHGLSIAETVPGKPHLVLSRDNWWARARGRDGERHFGIILETQGRSSMKVIGYYGPDQDPEGYFPLVRLRLIEAVQDWLSRGWVTLDDFTQPPPVVTPAPILPVRPLPRIMEPPAPAAVPLFELPKLPGRRAAQQLVAHLRRLGELDVDTPEVDQELERLEGDLQGWLDQVEEAFSKEEQKEEPNEDRLARLEAQRDDLQEAVTALGDRDIGQALEALDRAFPAAAPKPPSRVPKPKVGSLEELQKEASAFIPRIEHLQEVPNKEALGMLEANMEALLLRVLDALKKAGGPEKAPDLQRLARRFEQTAKYLESAKRALERAQGIAYRQALEALKACCS